jgi:ATP-binding cassette subfamily F protein 3
MSMPLTLDNTRQELDPGRVALQVVLESVQAIDGSVTEERARATMGALGLSGSKALQTIGTMSGGEKARVALSMFVLVPHNLLLLDEPSNHLDVGALDALTAALVDYTGTIVCVTHNRDLCEKMQATHVAMVRGDGSVVVDDRCVPRCPPPRASFTSSASR